MNVAETKPTTCQIRIRGGLTTTFHLSNPFSDLRDASLTAAQRQQQEQAEPRRRHLQMRPQSNLRTTSSLHHPSVTSDQLSYSKQQTWHGSCQGRLQWSSPTVASNAGAKLSVLPNLLHTANVTSCGKSWCDWTHCSGKASTLAQLINTALYEIDPKKLAGKC